MRCHNCNSHMIETRIAEQALSVQTWLECPVCGRVQLLSQHLRRQFSAFTTEVPHRFGAPHNKQHW